MPDKQQMQRIADGFLSSGLTRREYCEKHGITPPTLDYWRRKQKKKKARLVEVQLDMSAPSGFVLVLRNGRRIETAWSFREGDLQRLLRVAEA